MYPSRILGLAGLLALLTSPASSSANPPPTSLEHFVLESTDGAPGSPTLLGTLRLVQRPSGAHTLLESETRLVREGSGRGVVRVFAVEDLRPEHALLTWREIAEGSGRSLSAEWAGGSNGLEVAEWGNGPALSERHVSVEGALFPLYLLDLVRRGRLASGNVPCFDPLSRSIEQLAVHTSYDWDAAEPGERARTVELARLDGTLWARYRFVGARLIGLQWQEGGAWARAVDETEYERACTALAQRLRSL